MWLRSMPLRRFFVTKAVFLNQDNFPTIISVFVLSSL